MRAFSSMTPRSTTTCPAGRGEGAGPHPGHDELPVIEHLLRHADEVFTPSLREAAGKLGRRVEKEAIADPAIMPGVAMRRRVEPLAHLLGLARHDGEPMFAFTARAILAARKEGLDIPHFFPSAKREEFPFGTHAAGGTKAVMGPKRYTGSLTRTGREITKPTVLLENTLRNIQRKHNWQVVEDTYREHTLPWGRDKTLDQLMLQPGAERLLVTTEQRAVTAGIVLGDRLRTLDRVQRNRRQPGRNRRDRLRGVTGELRELVKRILSQREPDILRNPADPSGRTEGAETTGRPSGHRPGALALRASAVDIVEGGFDRAPQTTALVVAVAGRGVGDLLRLTAVGGLLLLSDDAPLARLKVVRLDVAGAKAAQPETAVNGRGSSIGSIGPLGGVLDLAALAGVGRFLLVSGPLLARGRLALSRVLNLSALTRVSPCLTASNSGRQWRLTALRRGLRGVAVVGGRHANFDVR